MDLNKLTEKSQAALMEAQNIATRNRWPRDHRPQPRDGRVKEGRTDLHGHAAEEGLRKGGDTMKTTQNKLEVLWEANVEFAVPVRPASAQEKIARPPCGRRILRDASLASKGFCEQYNRLPASELIVNSQA